MLLLELPPSRQSPTHIQLLEKFSTHSAKDLELELSEDYIVSVEGLVIACQAKNKEQILASLATVSGSVATNKEQHIILQKLEDKYEN